MRYDNDMGKRKCTVEGCSRQYFCREYCKMHYSRWYKTGNAGSAESRPRRKRRCEYDGCEGPHYAKGWCGFHYQRVRHTGSPEPRAIEVSYPLEWNAWHVTSNGYVMRVRIIGPGRQREIQLQHRHVMEGFLGRELLSEENVHHRNGVRHDNRLSNLELWTRSQPPGQRVTDKLKWAREILAMYEGQQLP